METKFKKIIFSSCIYYIYIHHYTCTKQKVISIKKWLSYPLMFNLYEKSI